MRTYSILYNAEEETTRIIFQDDNEPSNEFYVATSIPPFEDSNMAATIARALNNEQKVVY